MTHDELADLGIRIAMQLNRECDGPHEAVAVLAVAMGRCLCEMPRSKWEDALVAFSQMAIGASPGIDEMLIRIKDVH